MTCTSCGQTLPEGARFCFQCGSVIDGAPSGARRGAVVLATAETVAGEATRHEPPTPLAVTVAGVVTRREPATRERLTAPITGDVLAATISGPSTVIQEATLEHDPLAGRMVAGRFRVQSRLGAGGMGTVYLAEQLAVGRTVVLKFLHQRLTRERDLTQRFQREALAASRLSCPNTITLYDFGQTEDGVLYMAMEYLAGRTLAAAIESAGAISSLRAVGIALQILSSLAEAHDKGIVHRDLKPENIMLVERSGTNDFVKVLDFGIAKMIGLDTRERPAWPLPLGGPGVTGQHAAVARAGAGAPDELAPGLTQHGEIFGSPRYMAPEQILGEPVDARTDLYAVGTILYQMLLGHTPFDGESMMALFNRQVSEAPRGLCATHPDLGISPALDRLVLRCLAKSPDDRPESAAALADELRALTPDIAAQQEEQDHALLQLVGIKRRWPRWLFWLPLPVLALGGFALWLALRGGPPAAEGTGLAPGQRLFVSASAPTVPEWVDALAPTEVIGHVRDASSPERALHGALVEAAARLADLPNRYDPQRERALYVSDLRAAYAQLQDLQARGALTVPQDSFWAKLARGEADGKVRHVYDGHVRLRPAGPAVGQTLRRALADLRYTRYDFLTDDAIRGGRCATALHLADKTQAVIEELAVSPEKKERLRYFLDLKFKLGRCTR